MPDIKEKLKKLFTRKNKEENKPFTPAAAPKEPKIVKIKTNLKGEEETIMMPSIRNYSESDVEKAVKEQFKKADEKNEEIKKGGITKEELKRRGITVKQQ